MERRQRQRHRHRHRRGGGVRPHRLARADPHDRRQPVRRRQPGRRGFTLIELMIALTISALLIGMILSIFTRMSTAYRTQQYVADLQ
ncbi:MAG: prepilin-type N-terminal cleavage/methylation domain-containing protein, partial [Kofleriaceae bacterium]|nr:prepilin-type N-terminal cleavage/methylation domain-containing protein [Kofleriaceae bacterium]